MGVAEILRLGNYRYFYKNFGAQLKSQKGITGGHFDTYLNSLDTMVSILQAFKFFSMPFWRSVFGRNRNFKAMEPQILGKNFG